MGTTGQSVTLANSIIGVGILAMPFCFQQVSVTPCLYIYNNFSLIKTLKLISYSTLNKCKYVNY